MKNYTVFHLHSKLSNPTTIDSVTDFEEYIELAKENDMSAIAFSEHGNLYEWAKKKQKCDKAGIKYIHGVEAYMTTNLTTLSDELDNDGSPKVVGHREAMHIGLYAKNLDGVKELNVLITESFNKEDFHFYYKPRITLDELFATSDNIIVTTACLGGPIWQRRTDRPFIEKFMDWASENKDRVYLEIQYHDHPEQAVYNRLLHALSKKYDVPLIAGTDTHSSTSYKAECRQKLQQAKNMAYGDEDAFDLTFKTYDELVEAFEKQDALPMDVVLEAIENTNRFADKVEHFELDFSFKYPELYEDEEQTLKDMIKQKMAEKMQAGIITKDNMKLYSERVIEEFSAFKGQHMISFMAFMCELITWCWKNDIPVGYGRGSVAGSTLAYILDITDVDPIRWNTVFSRFVNPSRISLADVDLDFAPQDRDKVYKYIIDRFGWDYVAYIITFNTVAEKGTIDEIARADGISIDEAKLIKELFEEDEERAREKYPDVFYYFDGILGTIISKGRHPAGIVASPVTLRDNLGVIYDEGEPVTTCSMKVVDGLNFVKYDILGLKNVGIIKDTYKYLGVDYKRSHNMDWEDEDVWKDMITNPAGIFQFEGKENCPLQQ